MAETLTTTTGSGAQTTTQSPQTAGQSGTGGAPTSAVQPGTATELLSQSTGGVPLGGRQLSTISLAPVSNQTGQVAQPAKPARDINPALIAFPVVLLAVAVLLVWIMKRSVKNTT